MKELFGLKGKYRIRVYNNKEEMELISECETPNTVTNEMYNHILNTVFHGGTPITTWYLGVFETNTTPDALTTYAVPVFSESTAYDEATRPEFVESAASSQSLNNTSSKATFTASATKTFYGAFLCGGGTAPSTKGDVAGDGVMASAAKFGTAQPVIDGNVVALEYIISKA